MKLLASETISLPSVTNFRDPAAQTTGRVSIWHEVDTKHNKTGRHLELAFFFLQAVEEIRCFVLTRD